MTEREALMALDEMICRAEDGALYTDYDDAVSLVSKARNALTHLEACWWHRTRPSETA